MFSAFIFKFKLRIKIFILLKIKEIYLLNKIYKKTYNNYLIIYLINTSINNINNIFNLYKKDKKLFLKN